MHKRWGLLLITVIIIGVLLALYWYQQRQRQTFTYEGVSYNPFSQTWEPAQISDERDREAIVNSQDNSEGLHNTAIVKAYYEGYDENRQSLRVKALVPLSQGNLFEPLEFSLPASQTIYCAPQHYTDPNTGRTYQTSKLMVPVRGGEILYIPTEQVLPFDRLLTEGTDLTYLLIQLTQALDKNSTNYIQKLIVLDLCD